MTKIVKFLGGLGNQMFQYAFYLSLKNHFKSVKADISGFTDYELHNGFELERVFPIQLDYASSFELSLYTSDNSDWIWRKLRRFYGTKNVYWQETTEFEFDESIYMDKSNRYYWGYWQHINYIRPLEAELRKSFQFPSVSGARNEMLMDTIRHCNSISVHIRRGDYVGHSILGGICNKEYYEKALRMICERMDNPLFVFFSNDIDWCRESFQQYNTVFVDWNAAENSFMDMELMSACRHHIIANSSFSWWGAWLNDSPEKLVISPSKWTNDLNVDVSGILLPSFIKI